ncbi:hypothetical protein L915_07705, partial [Phytophthora nicotianae]
RLEASRSFFFNTHMGGASNHKRLTNPSPNKSWLAAYIQK